MSTIGTTLFSKIEINGQEVDIATLDANDGIYALPAGQTTANVKFTMINNTSIPRGVFEENSYITAMTLPDDMTYIASYSFHGVNNINISDKNAILAINPYAFDAEPTPPGPEPKTDPDLHYSDATGNYDLYTHVETIPTLTNIYNVSPITYVSSDTTVATVNLDGTINYLAVGNTSISASFAGDTTYKADTTSFTLTITDSTPVTDPDFYFYSNNYEVISGSGMGMDVNLYNGTGIDPMQHPIQWSSSSADITIDQNGYVSSSMVGATGTITATTSDGTNTHTATCTVNVVAGKQTPTGGWYENSSQVWNLDLVEGNTSDKTLTFSATPNDSWTFYDPGMPGISVNTTTGEITITGASVQSSESSVVSANRMEDASYYSGNLSLNIIVFPVGTDLNFHYDQLSVNLDNQGMTTITPVLANYTAIDTTLYPIQYVSGDTSVATVDAYGTITFVGGGTTTVTATLSDGNETHTATITVYCNVIKQTPYATWIDPSTQMSSNDITCTGGTTIQFGGTPLSGWTFSTTDPDLVIDQSTGAVTVPSGVLEGSTFTINASYTEDATYYTGSGTLTIHGTLQPVS